MDTIIFKPEFNTKLINLGIKTRFIDNLKNVTLPHSPNQCWKIFGKRNPTLEEKVEYLNRLPEWYSFIYEAFFWNITPEGQLYWSRVTNNGDFKAVPIFTPSLITFKPEFEQKLHELKIKQRFVRNLLANESGITRWNSLNRKADWKTFVRTAFTWRKTPEGSDYWINILNQ